MRLKKMAYGHKAEHRLRVRAQVVLHAAHGRSNACIARETGLHLDTVRRLRGLFAQAGPPGLKDRQRCGSRSSFTPPQATEVKSPACRLPAESEVPLSRWSCPELAREAARRGIAPFMSASTVRRRLAQDALKPWQHRSRIFTTSPGFRLKAACVLDLYARTWQGEQLGDDEYMISADEKTSIQAKSPVTAPDSITPPLAVGCCRRMARVRGWRQLVHPVSPSVAASPSDADGGGPPLSNLCGNLLPHRPSAWAKTSCADRAGRSARPGHHSGRAARPRRTARLPARTRRSRRSKSNWRAPEGKWAGGRVSGRDPLGTAPGAL
ncbi:helix-turn-helix domain-containing protein [Streptomyces carpinensis]|uniref:Helix-turn-helix domain-containing protein n=1 Tax=Streptomyces carpinensis TaxID=66369 RepID=A0ABV1W023_9ACTN|nr:helix-turn-helix domain-containing protein [Streptomyces carpinensis]